MRVPAPERERWLRAAWLHDALRDADAATSSDGRPGRAGRPSCGMARRARRAPRPRARPTKACWTPCGITLSARQDGTWSGGCCTARTTSSRVARSSANGEPSWQCGFPRIRPAWCSRWRPTGWRHLVESGWPILEPTVRILEQPRRARPDRVDRVGGVRAAEPGGACCSSRAASTWPVTPTRSPSRSKRIRVEVLNGTQRAGLARTATRALREQGLDVVFFGSGAGGGHTRIYVRRGDPGQGRDVAEALGVGRMWCSRTRYGAWM